MKIEITVNGVPFQEIGNPEFRAYYEHEGQDKFPFILSHYTHSDKTFSYRTYKSLQFNGKYYCPKEDIV